MLRGVFFSWLCCHRVLYAKKDWEGEWGSLKLAKCHDVFLCGNVVASLNYGNSTDSRDASISIIVFPAGGKSTPKYGGSWLNPSGWVRHPNAIQKWSIARCILRREVWRQIQYRVFWSTRCWGYMAPHIVFPRPDRGTICWHCGYKQWLAKAAQFPHSSTWGRYNI